MNNDDYDEISKQNKKQMLKLVTGSFYRELMNYGVDKSDIVSVSVNLLDLIMSSNTMPVNGDGSYRDMFKLEEIRDLWTTRQQISLNDVSLRPLQKAMVPEIAGWLRSDAVKNTLICLFPQEEATLRTYLMDRTNSFFFGIHYKNAHLVGVIGAENIDQGCRKLEMKKFIGADEFRHKGIGKAATFLFLYYAFHMLNFNKVYIHSLDTNINNINLNSKFGFDLEGILFKEVVLNNVHRDILRMGLLREKWLAIFSNEPELQA